jgi:hypothetical protein
MAQTDRTPPHILVLQHTQIDMFLVISKPIAPPPDRFGYDKLA